MNRKVVSLLSLLLILPLTSSPALAAGAPTERAGVLASLRSFLSSFLEMGRWTIDPDGATSETDGRWTIDPDGMMAPADPASEGRSTIDPNG
jgi:hypothetical protein